MSTQAPRRSGEWLEAWDPENEETWDERLAWKTLWLTTFALFLAFVAWFLPSALIPKLNPLGYSFSTTQLYWMAAMPGLSAGLFRLLWMVLPPIMGTRKMVALTSLLLVFSTLGWGVRVQEPTAPYWELMVLAFLAGIGYLVITLLISPVTMFLMAGEVEQLYRREGKEPPITTIWGLWFLLPIVGLFIWYIRIQKSLNDYWVAHGAIA